MRKFLTATMALCLTAGLAVSTANPCAFAQSAQPEGQSAKGTLAVTTSSAKAISATDELVALLPASDLIAVIDVGRAFNDLLPRLSSLSIGGLDKMAKDIQDFTSKTGIDPSKVRNAVLGLNLSAMQANGAIIIQGLGLDDKKIETALKAYNLEFKTTDYKGKPIFSVVSQVKSPSAGPLSLKTDETAIAVLDQQKVALGDLSAVKGVVDNHSGAAKGGVTPMMAGALKETKESALIRFALNIPDNIRQEASNQGDLFKSIGGIKVILGTFDVANDFSLSLDAIMRTASQNEAAELESGLKGLVSLAKGFLGGGDPKTDVIGQLLDQIKIGSKINDVSLVIAIPRSLIDQFSKKTANEEKK